RKSPSPLFCSSSTSAILSSVIGSSVVAGGSRKSTITHLPGDHLSLTRAPSSIVMGHYARRALTTEFSTTSEDANNRFGHSEKPRVFNRIQERRAPSWLPPL